MGAVTSESDRMKETDRKRKEGQQERQAAKGETLSNGEMEKKNKV